MRKIEIRAVRKLTDASVENPGEDWQEHGARWSAVHSGANPSSGTRANRSTGRSGGKESTAVPRTRGITRARRLASQAPVAIAGAF